MSSSLETVSNTDNEEKKKEIEWIYGYKFREKRQCWVTTALVRYEMSEPQSHTKAGYPRV
jgi:hypothetical protein